MHLGKLGTLREVCRITSWTRFMNEIKEYIALLIDAHVLVLVATSHVNMHNVETGIISVNSGHLNSVFAMSQLTPQMCLHFPIKSNSIA